MDKVPPKPPMTESPASYFLASRTVSRVSMRHLLLSASFGVNALLYAVWLGYSLGVYSLLIQVFWSLGFLLFNPLMKLEESAQALSLPGLLGSRFGRSMRIYAAVVTALGLVMLLGWEFAICHRTVTVQFNSAMNWAGDQSSWYTHFFLILTIAAAIYYTARSGLRADATAARFLNLIKVAFLGIITVLAIVSLAQKSPESLKHALFPTMSQISENFGLVALVTNLVFNLVWQVIDASSWQSVLAASPETRKEQFRVLWISGVYIFAFVGLFGSVIGMSLVGTDGVDPDNVLLKAVTHPGPWNFALLAGLFVTLATCLMTFVDGVFLTITQALTDDLLGAFSRFQNARLKRAAVMVFIAIGAWAVVKAVESTPFGLFNFVYVLIVPQLSLLGAVAMLRVPHSGRFKKFATAVCCLSLLAGVGFVTFGYLANTKWAMEIGGSASIVVSLFFALLLSKLPKS